MASAVLCIFSLPLNIPAFDSLKNMLRRILPMLRVTQLCLDFCQILPPKKWNIPEVSPPPLRDYKV